MVQAPPRDISRAIAYQQLKELSLEKQLKREMVEKTVFCPGCKAIQTIFYFGGRPIPTRKFKYFGSVIYHDCGSTQPCKIYGWKRIH